MQIRKEYKFNMGSRNPVLLLKLEKAVYSLKPKEDLIIARNTLRLLIIGPGGNILR